jgi:hypothetical protein
MTAALQQALDEVRKLPDAEQDEIAQWLIQELKDRAWETQIERDVAAGKLDGIAEQVLADHRAGKTTPL